MYKDSKFRQGFYWVLIGGLCLQILSLLLSELMRSVVGSVNQLTWQQGLLLFELPYLLQLGLLWGAIAYVFNLKKEVLVCVAALIITYLVSAPLYKQFKVEHYFILSNILNLFPYALFGFWVFRDRRMWSIILLGFMLSISYKGGSALDLPATVKSLLSIFGWDYMLLVRLFGVKVDLWFLISRWFIDVFAYLLISYALYTLQHKRSLLSLSSIDLSNRYPKLLATALFVVYNFVLMNLFRVPIRLGSSGISVVYGIIMIIGFLLTIYTIALMYRNFLVEFSLIEHGKVGWWYFLLGIPVVNVFAWIFVLISPSLLTTPEQVNTAFEEERKSGNDSIKAVILFLTIILGIFLVLGARDNRLSAIISALVGFALVAWYVSSPDGLWGLITITSVLIFLVAQGKWSIGRAFSFESVINNFVGLVVWFPLFHLWELRDVSAKANEHPEIEEKY